MLFIKRRSGVVVAGGAYFFAGDRTPVGWLDPVAF
jgi:hypothetical protein